MPENETALPEATPCRRCGGERFIAETGNNIRLLRQGSGLRGAFHDYSELNALVCAKCGYTELFARRPTTCIQSASELGARPLLLLSPRGGDRLCPVWPTMCRPWSRDADAFAWRPCPAILLRNGAPAGAARKAPFNAAYRGDARTYEQGTRTNASPQSCA